MRWFAKTFTGLLLAAALLAVGSYFAVNYAYNQLTQLPPKPTFPNDNPNFIKKNKSKSTGKNITLPQKEDEKLDDGKSGDKPGEKPKAKEEPKLKPLPAVAFEGRVSYPQGLVLRNSAAQDSGTIGGLEFNETLTVVETSPDGEWQKVRTSKDKEGWVRGGNIQKN
jgi:Bacterial SH3 domain